jgi:hypothetical protein
MISWRKGRAQMAEAPIVHIAENSPEQVAFKLMEIIAYSEGKLLRSGSSNAAADRVWLLDTYAECLRATRGLRKHREAPGAL